MLKHKNVGEKANKFLLTVDALVLNYNVVWNDANWFYFLWTKSDRIDIETHYAIHYTNKFKFTCIALIFSV